MTQEPPITQADRELLADEYYADGRTSLPMSIQEDAMDNVWYHHRLAFRAIAKARHQGREQGLREAAEVVFDDGQRWAGLREGVIFDQTHKAILALIDKPGGVG